MGAKVSRDLYERTLVFSEINWSEVIRKAIEIKVAEMEAIRKR